MLIKILLVLFLYFSFSVHKALYKEEVSYGCTSLSILMFVDVSLLLLIYYAFFD